MGIAANSPDSFPTTTLQNGLILNEWGMKFKTTELYNEFCEFPLDKAETRKDIEDYSFPDPYASGRYESAFTTLSKYRLSYGIIGDLETSIFETAWYFTGIGLDILNPIQPPAQHMTLEFLSKEFGQDLVFFGGIAIQDDTPVENILAFFEGIQEL